MPTTVAIVQADSHAMAIIECNEEASGYLDYVPNQYTVAYYPLNSDTQLQDKSGNGYNMTLVGGSFGEANGVNCYITTSKSQGLYSTAPYSKTCTISVWFKNTSTGSYQSIIDRGNHRGNTSNGIIGAWYNHSTSYGLSLSSYGNPESMTRSLIDTSVWHNIVITGSEGNWIEYLDGQQIQTLSYNVICQNVFNIAKAGDNTTEGMIGNFSRAIYESRTWTAQEVLNYYNKTKKYFGIS